MNGPITGDPILDGLRRLPRLEPSARATARIRARSLTVVEGERERRNRWRGRMAALVIDGAIALVSFVYLTGAAAQAVRLFSALR
jgi:hypothetical protein